MPIVAPELQRGGEEVMPYLAGKNDKNDFALDMLSSGGSIGMIETDQEFRKKKIAVTIHERPRLILDYMLKDSDSGAFKRQTFKNYLGAGATADEGRIALWQCREEAYGNNQPVDYLILMRIETNGQVIKVSFETIGVEDISDAALRRTVIDALLQSKGKHAIRAKIDSGSRFTLIPAEYGQTIFTFQGSVGVNEELSLVDKSSANQFSAFTDHSQHTSIFLKQVCKSLHNIVCDIEKNFSRPGVIDERRRDEFKKGDLINPLPLSDQETDMLKSLRSTEEEVIQGASRVAGTVKDSVEKFLLYQDDGLWGMASAVVHTSAANLTAQLWVLDTYEAVRAHKENHGNLPRKVWKKIGGTRGQQYR